MRRRWLLVTLVCVFVILLSGSLFYRSIQSPMWKESDAAVERAKQETELMTVREVRSHSGEDQVLSVFGEDAEGRDMIVLMTETVVESVYGAQYVDEDRIHQQVLALERSADILRTVPGRSGQQWIWEVFCRLNTEGRQRYYYQYYRLTDGKLLRTVEVTLP